MCRACGVLPKHLRDKEQVQLEFSFPPTKTTPLKITLDDIKGLKPYLYSWHTSSTNSISSTSNNILFTRGGNFVNPFLSGNNFGNSFLSGSRR